LTGGDSGAEGGTTVSGGGSAGETGLGGGSQAPRFRIDESPTSTPADPDGVGAEEVVGGAAVGAAGAGAAVKLAQLAETGGVVGRSGAGAAGGVGLGFPAIGTGIIAQSEQRREQGRGGLLERILPDLPNLGGGRSSGTRMAAQRETPTASTTERINATQPSEVTVDTTVEAEGVTERDVERAVERAKQEAKEELRRELTRGQL